MSCSRDCKKFGLAAGAAVVLRFGLEFLTHEVALKSTYVKYAALWNPESVMKGRCWSMIAAHVLFGVIFAKIYAHGYEDEKCGGTQGLRFGLLAGLLVAQHALISYAVYPVSLKLALAWFAAEVVQCALIGFAVGKLYKPAPETAHSH